MKKKSSNNVFQILVTVLLFMLLNNCSKDEVIPEDEKFIAISAHGSHSLALKGDSTLWAWGANGTGALGDGTLEDRKIPTWIGTGFTVIAAGGSAYVFFSSRYENGYSLALKADGSLWGWGYNGYGQLGDGTYENKSIPTLIDSGYMALSAGENHSLGIKKNGTLWAWGSNSNGKLGIGQWDGSVNYPVQVGSDFIAVSAGTNHSLALKADGTLWAWGNNHFNELGDGTNVDKNQPIQIGSDYAAISAGDQSFAIKTNGTMWAWGPNPHNELGTGDGVSRKSPVQIGIYYVGSIGFASISTGRFHTMALKTDNTLWAWGINDFGELFDGQTKSHGIPFLIGSDYTKISAGHSYSLAIKTDGSLWACGNNYFGQLGDGTRENRITPVRIGRH